METRTLSYLISAVAFFLIMYFFIDLSLLFAAFISIIVFIVPIFFGKKSD